MRITASQLRSIIKEEIFRIGDERRALEQFVKDCSVNAGLPYPTFERLTSTRNMEGLRGPRYLSRMPTPEDLELLRQVWEEGKLKYGSRRSRFTEAASSPDPRTKFCVPCGEGPYSPDQTRCPHCKEPLDSFGDLPPDEQELIRSSM